MLLTLKILLMAVSFAGLCALAGQFMAVDGFSGPLVASGGAIVLLMLGGMLRILPWTWRLLYYGGFIGFAWVHLIRRRRIEWAPVLIAGLALIFACFRFRGAYFTHGDTLSHWAMAPKYLLRTDRFPDASTQLIYFQDYPLGSAAFIYYFCRAVSSSDGAYLGAQFMLQVFALMPVMGFASKRRILGGVLFGLGAICLLAYNGFVDSLLVDGLLASMAIGGTAIVLQGRGRPKRTGALALVIGVALAYIKVSGMLFALLIALFQCHLARRAAAGADRRRADRTFLLTVLGIAAAFALWQLHVKQAYPTGFESKHAVSLRGYMSALAGRSPRLIRSIAGVMLRHLFRPAALDVFVAAMIVGGFALLAVLAKRSVADRAIWPAGLRWAGIALAVSFAVWYALIFVMFVLSMPEEEIRNVIALERYERTMLMYIAGIAMMLAIAFFCRTDAPLKRAWIAPGAACAAVAVAAMLFLASGDKTIVSHENRADTKCRELRQAKAEYGIAEEGAYLVFDREGDRALNATLYLTKYELFSNDIKLIIGGINRKGFDPDRYYTFSNTYMQSTDIAEVEDLAKTLAESMDQCDCLLVYNDDPVFGAALDGFLETYEGNAQVVRIY